MCFGPTVSFLSSAVLLGVGIACLRRTPKKEERLLAAFPLFFAVQQLDEGLLWLGLLHQTGVETIHWLAFSFLLVALCAWPVLAPSSVYFIEPKPEKKKAMLAFILLGAAFSLYCLFFLISGSCSANIARACIQYKRELPGSNTVLIIVYALSLFGASFLSSYRPLVKLASVNILLGGFAFYIHHRAFISIWCFFAAATSVSIYLFLCSINPSPEPHGFERIAEVVRKTLGRLREQPR